MDFLKGELICKAKVVEKTLEAKGGFDVGKMILKSGGDEWELTYVNEYMTLEKDGERLATFPDLMTTFDVMGEPVTSSMIEKGATIYLANVPKELIMVGDGNKYADAIEPIEAVLEKPMVKYLKGYLKG